MRQYWSDFDHPLLKDFMHAIFISFKKTYLISISLQPIQY